MAFSTVSHNGRPSTPVVEVAPGLWVAKPIQRAVGSETIQERLRRRFAKRPIFSRPLVPEGTSGRVEDTQPSR